MNTFYLLDRDPRYLILGEMLEEEGNRVLFYPEEIPPEPLFYLFPLGLGEEAVQNVLSTAKEGSFALVGKTTPALHLFAKEKKITLRGALEDEIYLFQNAKATAEGVLKNVIETMDRTLDELTLLVYGFGNCGSAIARLLWLAGCEIFVCSRERGNKAAEKEGFNIYSAENLGLGMFDGVINTVPTPIFSDSLLFTMAEDSHFFQVATGLSGIDPEKLESRKIHFHPLPRLPGLYAPRSEALGLYDLITRSFENPKE